MRLVLGTVQFGLDYGISNAKGQIPFDQVTNILRHAKQVGVDLLDTAVNYGNCEDILGEAEIAKHGFGVVTKIPSLEKYTEADIPTAISETINQSKDRLCLHSLYGVLLHDAADLLGPNADTVYDALVRLKQEQVKKIGVSVYYPQQLETIIARYAIDLVQLPLNLLDQRFVDNRLLDRLHESGIEVHVRSIFLQGLLLMPIAQLSAYFSPIKSHLLNLHEQLGNATADIISASFDFLKTLCVERAVCGVCDLQQFQMLVTAINTRSEKKINYSQLRCDKEEFILPSNWTC